MYTEFWSGNSKGRYHLGDLNMEGSIISKCFIGI
jgi:hypothetical protein